MSNKIRDKILHSTVPSEVVYIPDWDVKVEVRQRTVKEQYELIQKVSRPGGDLDGMMLAVETVIACTYDPDTGERVFDAADRDMLLSKDMGAFQLLLAASNRASGLEGEDEVVSRLDATPAVEPSTG